MPTQRDMIISRRSVIAGAAAGAVGLAATPAEAQRCPLQPATRSRGPLVWMDMDQHELDEAYDQSVYAFNQRFIAERRLERSQLVLDLLGKPERVAYGEPAIEKPSGRTRRP